MFTLLACVQPAPELPPVDLAASLAEDEVRAGVVTDVAALFGGVSAEGRLGDFKLYNSRVRFILQQPGDSSYYVEYGGGLIDADIVRPDEQPGRDSIDEVAVMVGLGRVCEAERVEVVADGSTGVATVRVEGPAAPMRLLTGALENTDIVADLDLWIRTDFTLAPGASTLLVTTTAESREVVDVTLAIGDVALVAMDIAEPYVPGRGLLGPDLDPVDWSAVIGRQNEVAFALLGADEALEQGTIGQLLGSIAPAIAGFGPATTIPAGGSLSWTRRIGVARDPATLVGEQLDARGVATEVRSGQLRTRAGDPVAGARVHLLDGAGAPSTLAFADAEGRWEARVPEGAPDEVLATGRGSGIRVDLPAGAGWYAPYGADNTLALTSLAQGSPPIPFAGGCGASAVATAGSVALPGCGTLRLRVSDGGPAAAWLYPTTEDPAVDERLVPSRPSGATAIGYVRDGEMDIPVEPGDYSLVVSRGVRFEVWRGDVHIGEGGATEVEAAIQPAWSVPGVVSGDPHSHAAPSGDGGISMEDRLVVTAANGIEVHFGTDHDHVVDYGVLLEPLGLTGRLRSVVADEVSPVLRGHFNVYPASVGTGANHGAPRWWLGYEDTAEIFGWMRTLAGPTGIVQANHPVGSSGMFSIAGYDPSTGEIASSERWSSDFDAMEVVNSGDREEYFPYYLDLVRRGHPVVPVGVSDSHAHTSGHVGLAQTFFLTDGGLAEFDDATLVATMRRGATVVSFGPFIDVYVGEMQAPGRVFHGGSVVVRSTVYAPSWMPVEQVTAWVDGEPVSTVPCRGVAPRWCEVEQLLQVDADASVVITAESVSGAMVYSHPGERAWAMAAAFFLDADGDGRWTPPYPPLDLR